MCLVKQSRARTVSENVLERRCEQEVNMGWREREDRVGWSRTSYHASVPCVFPDEGLSVGLEAGKDSISEGYGGLSPGLPAGRQIHRVQHVALNQWELDIVLCSVYGMRSSLGSLPEFVYTSRAIESDPGLLE